MITGIFTFHFSLHTIISNQIEIYLDLRLLPTCIDAVDSKAPWINVCLHTCMLYILLTQNKTCLVTFDFYAMEPVLVKERKIKIYRKVKKTGIDKRQKNWPCHVLIPSTLTNTATVIANGHGNPNVIALSITSNYLWLEPANDCRISI